MEISAERLDEPKKKFWLVLSQLISAAALKLGLHEGRARFWQPIDGFFKPKNPMLCVHIMLRDCLTQGAPRCLYNKVIYRGDFCVSCDVKGVVGLKKRNCCIPPPPGVTCFFNNQQHEIGTKTVTPGGRMQRNSFTMTSHIPNPMNQKMVNDFGYPRAAY
jgi:hypothetical protein